jgi:hypothetical protein
MISLKEFSNIVKNIIANKIDDITYAFINQLPLGETNYKFRFILDKNRVKILSSLRSMQTAFEIAKIMFPQKDYTLSIRLLSGGETKTISKSAPIRTSLEKLEEEILSGMKVDRIFYKIATTEDFEITFSEYEGTIVNFKDELSARRFIQLLAGLFPFIELKKENKIIDIHCKFLIEKYDGVKKNIEKKGKLSCKVTLDGYPMGTKLSSFFF